MPHVWVGCAACAQHTEQLLPPLLKAKLRVLWEGAMDVARDDVVLLLPLAHALQELGVAAAGGYFTGRRPRHSVHCSLKCCARGGGRGGAGGVTGWDKGIAGRYTGAT